MQSPEGGYYSSLDADSEGEEGKYYVWTPQEVRALLTPDEFAVASAAYGLDRPPNFEGKYWHLILARALGEIARELELSEGAAEVLLDSARRKLYAAREKRVRPGLDDKVLASWNALMIAGMARAARVFANPVWLASARRALDFMRRTMWKDGKLLATYKDDRAHLDAYLDDHAYLLAALLEVMQADFRPQDLAWADEIGRVLMDEFYDSGEGGFFFTSHGHEQLIHRPKPGPDNATPSGNAVAALALNRLAFLTGERRFSEAAAKTLTLFWPQLEQHPHAFCTLLAALEEQLTPPRTVIVVGARVDFPPWRKVLDAAYLPSSIVLFIPAASEPLPAPLRKTAAERVNAWVCEGVTCLPPIESPDKLRATLDLAKMRASETVPTP
jgi:uncharacterized protein YyaL (SSP411 family)